MCPGNCKRSPTPVTPIIAGPFVNRTVNFDRKSRRRVVPLRVRSQREEEDEKERRGRVARGWLRIEEKMTHFLVLEPFN